MSPLSILLLVIGISLSNVYALVFESCSKSSYSDLLPWINKDRLQKELSPLYLSPDLILSSSEHSLFAATKGVPIEGGLDLSGYGFPPGDIFRIVQRIDSGIAWDAHSQYKLIEKDETSRNLLFDPSMTHIGATITAISKESECPPDQESKASGDKAKDSNAEIHDKGEKNIPSKPPTHYMLVIHLVRSSPKQVPSFSDARNDPGNQLEPKSLIKRIMP